MAIKSQKIINEDGTKETIILSSDDDKSLILDKNYVIANHNAKKESMVAKKFKGSILGSEIGFKNKGFTSMAALASVIAVAAILLLYFVWRF